MTVKDILPDRPVEYITVRTDNLFDGDSILLGICSWDGENLIPLDGDSYYLNDEICRYEWHEDGLLTYWV